MKTPRQTLAVILIAGTSCLAQTPHAAFPIGRQGQVLDVDNTGVVTVADRESNQVVMLTVDLKQAREIGGYGWGNDQFDQPSGLWARNGIDVFVADYGNHRIQRFDRTLNYISTLSTRSSDNPEERFGYPTDVAVSRFGDLYIVDSENSRVLKVGAQNVVGGIIGGMDAGRGRLIRPTRVGVGPEDRVCVLDGSRVVIFDAFGNFVSMLAEGVFHDPSVLYADALGLIVVDGGMVYGFDSHERPACVVTADSLLGDNRHGPIFSLAVNRGRCYCLTSGEIRIVPDPRFAPPAGLDKEGKSQ